MFWLSVTAVGFLLVTALVIWLARTSTARWEREKRAARAPRHDAGAEPAPAGAAARLRRALEWATGAVPRITGSTSGRVRQVAGVLTTPKRLLTHVPAVRPVLRPLTSAVRGAGIRRWTRTTTGVPDLPVETGEGGGEGRVQQRPARRRRPFRFPHRSHRKRSSGPRASSHA